jgi:hypothetical protein
MARAIIGVIVGYVVLAIVVFAVFTGAYLMLGADGSFEPGTYDPSTTWLIVNFVTALLAALASGYVCAVIAKRSKPVLVLAIIVAAVGCAEGVYHVMNPKPDPGPRTAEVGNLDAMMKAKTPAWINVANAGMAIVFIPMGGRLRKQEQGGPSHSHGLSG